MEVISERPVRFDYTTVPINDLRVETELLKSGRKQAKKIFVNDEPITPTARFWSSLCARYQLSDAFYKYFDHAEVFDRIHAVEKNDRVRLCIERLTENDGKQTSRLLAASNPKRPLVVYDELIDKLEKYNGANVSYSNGCVESVHTPRIGASNFSVGGDLFGNRFCMSCPVDGYGMPSLFLMFLRMICENGIVGYTKTFRSQVALGKGDDDIMPSLVRALDGFNHDEGYAALRQRIEASQNSWASVYETTNLYKLLVKTHSNNMISDLGGVTPAKASQISGLLAKPGRTSGLGLNLQESGTGSKLLAAFHRMTGDTAQLYGLANLDALTVKRQRTLPVKCSVYDAINFATEVATHYANPDGARRMQAWVGDMISTEYDLENTKSEMKQFADFHVSQKIKAGTTGSQFSAN